MSSSEHRKKLEALFSGSKVAVQETPKPAREVFSQPRRSTGRSMSTYRVRLERLRAARERDDIIKHTDTFREHHQLPDDLEILMKVLRHPNEKIVRDALGQISALLTQGRVAPMLILDERLRDLAQEAKEPATRSYIEGVQAQINSLRQ